MNNNLNLEKEYFIQAYENTNILVPDKLLYDSPLRLQPATSQHSFKFEKADNGYYIKYKNFYLTWLGSLPGSPTLSSPTIKICFEKERCVFVLHERNGYYLITCETESGDLLSFYKNQNVGSPLVRSNGYHIGKEKNNFKFRIIPVIKQQIFPELEKNDVMITTNGMVLNNNTPRLFGTEQEQKDIFKNWKFRLERAQNHYKIKTPTGEYLMFEVIDIETVEESPMYGTPNYHTHYKGRFVLTSKKEGEQPSSTHIDSSSGSSVRTTIKSKLFSEFGIEMVNDENFIIYLMHDQNFYDIGIVYESKPMENDMMFPFGFESQKFKDLIVRKAFFNLKSFQVIEKFTNVQINKPIILFIIIGILFVLLSIVSLY